MSKPSLRAQVLDPGRVAANREGRITPDQKKALVEVTSLGRGGWIALLVWAVLIALFVKRYGKAILAMGRAGEAIGFGIVVGSLIAVVLVVGKFVKMGQRARWAWAKVEPRDGRVEFFADHYRPMVDGKALRSVFFDEQHLVPDPYVFYCIKGTNWVISAANKTAPAPSQGAMPADITDAPRAWSRRLTPAPAADVNEIRRALSVANGFSADDLALNRNGQLGRQQRKKLRRKMRSRFWTCLLCAGGAAFIVAYEPIARPANKIGFYVPAVILLAVILVVGKGLLDALTDSASGSVLSAEGLVKGLVVQTTGAGGESGAPASYYYALDPIRVRVCQSGYEALLEGLRYRLYYSPRSKTLLSIEPLP